MGRAFPRTKRTSHIRVEVAAMPDDMRPRQKESKADTAKEPSVAPTPTAEADPVPSEVAAPVDPDPSDDVAAPSDDGEAQAENKQE